MQTARWATPFLLLAGLGGGPVGCGSSGEIRVERGDPIDQPSGPSATRAGGPRPGDGAPFSK
ncbi:MAG: hypothetical protein KDA21_08720 [Phycisphaerales bacterium]|nr:hypothetical protein [Phycisphaerales bacterium]